MPLQGFPSSRCKQELVSFETGQDICDRHLQLAGRALHTSCCAVMGRAGQPLQDLRQNRCKQRLCERLEVQPHCEGSPRVVRKLTLPGQLTLAPLEPLKLVLTLTCSRDKGVSGKSTMGCFCLQPGRP